VARIAGVNLPNQKRLEIGLTYIYGIGQPTARKVAAALGLSPDTKIRASVQRSTQLGQKSSVATKVNSWLDHYFQ
jgi:ribosomal protein S13